MKKISILIPCFNEEKTIEIIVEKVLKANTLDLEKEIIVINDGSTDRTEQILKRLASQIKIVHLNQNKGKGFAIEQGKLHVTGDIILIQDADLEYCPSDYPALIKPFLENQSQAVFGIRNRQGQYHKFFLNPYYWGGTLINVVFNLLAGTKLKDLHVGYKLVRADLFSEFQLKEQQFNFCHELAWNLAERKIKIDQIPIGYRPRRLRDGKKIRARDGVSSLIFIFKKYASTKVST
jgi:glycosyltransferase involved in cell wall biosynthesis